MSCRTATHPAFPASSGITTKYTVHFDVKITQTHSSRWKQENWLNSAQSLSHSVMSNSCDPMDYSTPGFPVHHQLLELTQTHVHGVDGAIQPSHPLLSPSPTFNLSQHQGLFQLVLHIRWPKDWSFSFSISPSNEYSGLISFRMD